jgi:polyketide synthase 12
LRDLLGELNPGPEQLPIVSTVTGEALAGKRFDADYWVRNLAEPVLFRDAVDVLLGRGHDVFLEVSPHPLVKHSLESCLERAGRQGTLLASMRRGKEPFQELEGSLRGLVELGARERQDEAPPLANTA